MEKESDSSSNLLTEEELRKLSKDCSRILPDDPSPLDEQRTALIVPLYIRQILSTVQLLDISSSHRAAATNALCGIIERCEASHSSPFRSLVQSNDLWISGFNVFLQWSHAAKGKSMRQLLLTLGRSLNSLQNSEKHALVDQALANIFNITFKEREALEAKAGLHALELFLSRDIVSLPLLLQSFQQWAASNFDPSLKSHSQKSITKVLIFVCLQWLASADKTAAAAHLTCTLCEKASITEQEDRSSVYSDEEIPIWAEPAIAVVRRSPSAINALQNHVFPTVFRQRPLDVALFLRLFNHGAHLELDPQSEGVAVGGRPDSDDDNDTALLYAALQTGKDIGIIQEVEADQSRKIEGRDGRVNLPDAYFRELLSDPSPMKRLAGLSLPVTSASISQPFSEATLKCLRKNMPNFHVDPDANFRTETLHLIQRLVDRLRAVTSALSRPRPSRTRHGSAQHHPEDVSESAVDAQNLTLQLHIKFIDWYRIFLISELRPTAPYQRRISSLKAFLILLKSGLDLSVPTGELSKQAQGQIQWPIHIRILDDSLVQSTLNLLMDPYDDIRSCAATILAFAANAVPGQAGCLEIDRLGLFLSQAETLMLSSGRADHGDGVARAYALLYAHPGMSFMLRSTAAPQAPSKSSLSRIGILQRLVNSIRESINVTKRDFAQAIDAHPMHGALAGLSTGHDVDYQASLRYPAIEEIHRRIVASLRAVWKCVRRVLCDDAPEGHIPENFEDTDLDTKSVLSFCWRALKEARTSEFQTDFSPTERQELFELGNLCFEQLVELRHRGAFSTVAQAFATCCMRCGDSVDPMVRGYLDVWYKEALVAIRNQASVTTRRSAGIPSLITSILSADPTPQRFAEVMGALEGEAKAGRINPAISGTELSQVHALNCLKDIFRTTRLGRKSERYIEIGFDLVGHCLKSDTWAIRNCGLMLFRALIDRLLGTNESQLPDEPVVASHSRISFDKYPKVLDIILRFLKASHASLTAGNALVTGQHWQQGTTENVFPVFYILQRAIPPREHIVEIKNLVLSLTASPQWIVRDMAARTFAALVATNIAVETLQSVLTLPIPSQNSLHGRLLAAKYTIRTRLYFAAIDAQHNDEFVVLDKASRSGPSEVTTLFRFMEERSTDLYLSNPCPITKTVYVECISLFAPFEDITSLRVLFDDDIEGRKIGVCDSLLRKSVEALAGEYPLKNKEFSVSHIKEGESNHPTTQFEVMQNIGTAPTSISTPRVRLMPQLNVKKFATLESQLLSTTHHSERAALVELLSRLACTMRGHYADKALLRSTQSKLDLDVLINNVTDLSSEESALQLYGFYLETELLKPETEHSVEQLHSICRRLRYAIHDFKPLLIRRAVATALSFLRASWISPYHPTVRLRLHFIIQDVLEDDDEDVRELAAVSVAHILEAESGSKSVASKVSSVAKKQHCKYLLRTYDREGERKSLLFYFAAKLTGSNIDSAVYHSQLLFDSVTNIFARNIRRRVALFDQEDQNLYRDQTLEHACCVYMIEKLSRGLQNQGSSFQGLMEFLSSWVMDGLATLTSYMKLDVNDGQGPLDGPLGWTYSKETFALSYGVLRASGLLLAWRMQSRQGPVKASWIKKALFGFLEAAEQSNANPLLVEVTKRTITEGCKLTLQVLDRKIEARLGCDLTKLMSSLCNAELCTPVSRPALYLQSAYFQRKVLIDLSLRHTAPSSTSLPHRATAIMRGTTAIIVILICLVLLAIIVYLMWKWVMGWEIKLYAKKLDQAREQSADQAREQGGETEAG
ncbi:MAG: hypothetical protein Q9165_000335 [Trypethelium subeluteriae]